MKNNKKLINILTWVMPGSLSLLIIGFIILLTKYSEVSTTLIVLISIALLAILALVILVAIYGIYIKNQIFKIVAITMALLLSLASGFGIYYLYNINASMNLIIVDGNEKETVTVAFVTYYNSEITGIKDISTNDKFGYIDNEAFQAGNILALEEIDNQGIEVKMVTYDTYNDLLLGLFNEEVDIAALPDNYYEMFVVNEGYQEYLDKTTTIHRYSKEVDTNGIDIVDKDIINEPFSILILGIDEERSDTIILTTFNPQRMIVTMTHIARDSFVPIACYNNNQSDKINHARSVSRSCMIDTVEDLMDVEIDFFLEANFKGVVDIVDALGGLWLTSPVEFVGQTSSYDRGTYTVWVDKGYQLMDGEQVLAYARERYAMPFGDFTRQENQKDIIVKLVSTLLETSDINKALSVIKAAGSNINTNLSLNQMTQLLNFGFSSLNDTYVGQRNGSLIFKVISTSLVGYSSYTYNEGSQLPLWIFKPYNGSIADNVKIMNRNLEVDKTLKEYFNADFDIMYPHYEPTSYVPDTYNEKQVHEVLPDFMPKMVRGKEPWTLEMVNEWHSTRNSVNLVLKPIKPGDVSYDENLPHHKVIYQSVNYGVKISNISTLEIHYIQKDLNCSLEENQIYFECSDSYVVPNFVGQTLANVNSWAASHTDKTVEIIYVDNTSSVKGVTYDQNMVNKIGAQSAGQYTKWDSISNRITLYYFNYPKVNLEVSVILSLNGDGAVKGWFDTNGWLVDPEITKVYDNSDVGSVLLIEVKNDDGTFTNLTSDGYYRVNRKIYVTISKGAEVANALPDFVTENLYLANFEDYMNDVSLSTSGVTINQVDRPEGSDETVVGKITAQSVVPGTTNYQMIKTMEITIYQ